MGKRFYNCYKCKDRNWLIICNCGCGGIKPLYNKWNYRGLFISGHITKNRNQLGSNNKNWKGGRSKHKKYPMLYMPWHPNSWSNGYVKEHIWVMSRHLKRPLEKYEHIHHINGQKDDNRIENLMIVTRENHTKIHFPRIDMSDRRCSNTECKDPKKTRIDEQGYAHWQQDGKGGWLCYWCWLKNYWKKYKRKKKILIPISTATEPLIMNKINNKIIL